MIYRRPAKRKSSIRKSSSTGGEKKKEAKKKYFDRLSRAHKAGDVDTVKIRVINIGRTASGRRITQRIHTRNGRTVAIATYHGTDGVKYETF